MCSMLAHASHMPAPTCTSPQCRHPLLALCPPAGSLSAPHMREEREVLLGRVVEQPPVQPIATCLPPRIGVQQQHRRLAGVAEQLADNL